MVAKNHVAHRKPGKKGKKVREKPKKKGGGGVGKSGFLTKSRSPKANPCQTACGKNQHFDKNPKTPGGGQLAQKTRFWPRLQKKYCLCGCRGAQSTSTKG